MTDLMNGTNPTTPITQPAAAMRDTYPPREALDAHSRSEGKKADIHPKQAHLNTLIHAKIVTHLVHVDEVPDTLFALSQMQDLPEVRFAAIFDDGLIALGCPTGLPEALASIAVPAVPTALSNPRGKGGLQRIEEVSYRLEALIDTMEPEEVIVNEKLGKSILDRLTSLETQIANSEPQTVSADVSGLQSQIAALQERMTAAPDLAPAIAILDAKISDIATADPQTDQVQYLAELSDGLKSLTQQVKAQAALTQAFIGSVDEEGPDQGSTQLLDQMARLERTILNAGAIAPSRNPDTEKALRSLTQSVQSFLKSRPEAEHVTEKIEQLGAAQRTAFTRIEAAVAKAMSGLEPALDHLNARAADTENMMSDWHKDLRTLSVHTRSIADSTEQLPQVFTNLQSDMASLANAPAPVIDLSAQEAGFAKFATDLSGALKQIEGVAQRVEDKSAKAATQSEETIATLQTLPNLISAALRHEVDLKPIEQSLADLGENLEKLPENMNLAAIAAGLSAVSDQITPINDTQAIAFEDLQSSVKFILSHLQHLGDDVTRLHAKEPDFDPLQDLIANVDQQIASQAQSQEGQLNLLRDMLTGLAQHLGAAPQQAMPMVTSSTLTPETSINTLRMEFADLISKRMKENNTPFTAHPRSA